MAINKEINRYYDYQTIMDEIGSDNIIDTQGKIEENYMTMTEEYIDEFVKARDSFYCRDL